jgi:hypothetical protein
MMCCALLLDLLSSLPTNHARQMRTITFEGRPYFDDRIYLMEVRRVNTKSEKEKGWMVLIRRNTFGFPPSRADDFETWEAAVEYLRHFEPLTPRVSLAGKSPEPAPSYDEYQAWLRENRLSPSFIWPKSAEGKSR